MKVPEGAEGPPRGLPRVSGSAPRDPWEHQREHLITKRTPKVVSWDQHVSFGGLKWVLQDQNGSLQRPKMGFEEDVVGSFWVMWAFLPAQFSKNWSISFFEKVTLLNLMPSTSPNWGGGFPGGSSYSPPAPRLSRVGPESEGVPFLGHVALLIAELFQKR